jgi:RimJ/RimL family protein N-acetyltransferase
VIELKPFDSVHLDVAFKWRNDERIWGWCRQNDLISWAEHLAWYQSMVCDDSIKMYAIVCAQQLKPVGVCGLTSIDRINRRAEFSLYIGPENQGQGYAQAALKALISKGFHNHGLNCIWGETFAGNPAAVMFENIGFKKEGTRRQFYFRDGRFIDAHLYSILASEWEKS